MELDLLELFGNPPPLAVAALAVGAAVVLLQLVRRLRRRDAGGVAIRLADERD